MSFKTDDLFLIIESLPLDVKTTLVEKILNSLHPLQKDVDEKWVEMAEERINEIKAGKVHVIPGERVFKEVRGKYGV